MGMQVLCERQGRTEESQQYAQLSRRCWRRAEVGIFDTELTAMREERRRYEFQRAAVTPPVSAGSSGETIHEQ
jgi:hypothetical protein